MWLEAGESILDFSKLHDYDKYNINAYWEYLQDDCQYLVLCVLFYHILNVLLVITGQLLFF